MHALITALIKALPALFFRPTPGFGMRERVHEVRNHNNFMTDKERAFVENYHRKSISNALNHKDFSPFFEEKPSGALLVMRREPRTEHRTENNETQRNLFSGGFAKSRKKPRLVALDRDVSLPVEVQTELKIEEFCILVLKIKYRYNEIHMQEKISNLEYDPEATSETHIVEYETVAVSMLNEYLVRFSRSAKFFNALYELYASVNSIFKKNIVLSLLKSSKEIEFTMSLGDFVDRIFRNIPKINKEEILEFCTVFYENTAGVVFATALVLNDKNLARTFKLHLNDKVVMSMFVSLDRKVMWQFFSVLVPSLNTQDKKDLILFVREILVKAIREKDKHASIFLKSIGIEEDDLK